MLRYQQFMRHYQRAYQRVCYTFLDGVAGCSCVKVNKTTQLNNSSSVALGKHTCVLRTGNSNDHRYFCFRKYGFQDSPRQNNVINPRAILLKTENSWGTALCWLPACPLIVKNIALGLMTSF